jgi:hypothetical protein
MKTTTIDMPPLSVRAEVQSANANARTVDVIFSTGAAVDRVDPYGQRYREVLSMDPAHVRLGRLNAGAPLLNAHSAYSLTDVLGTVEQSSARIAAAQGIATVRFSKRPEVEPIWRDVVDGIIGSVSVGYRVHKFEETSPRGATIPTRTAVDWEPYELSLVPMPADAGARVRSADAPELEFNRCEIVPAPAVVDGSAEADAARIRRLDAAIAAERAPEAPATTQPSTAVVDPAPERVPSATPRGAAPAAPQRTVPADAIARSHSIDMGAAGIVRWNDRGMDVHISSPLDTDRAMNAALRTALRTIETMNTEIHEMRNARNVTIKRALRDLDEATGKPVGPMTGFIETTV